MMRANMLKAEEVEHLIIGKVDLNPGNIPDPCKSFVTENMWAAIKALDNSITIFNGIYILFIKKITYL